METKDLSRRAAAALALTVFGALAAACAASDPDDSGRGRDGRSAKPGQPALAAAATRIDTELRRDFPEHYAGVEIDPVRAVVIVYRRPSEALDSALRSRFGDLPARPHDAPHSARELRRLAERLRGDTGYWRKRGISITSLAVRPNGTAVVVGTREVAEATAELPRRYGGAPLDIVHADPRLPTPPQ